RRRETAPLIGTQRPEAAGAGPRPLRAQLLSFLWAWALRIQAATWRKEVEGLDRVDELLARRVPVIVAFWHGRYTPLFTLLSGRDAVIFTSLSFRGSVISGICRRFGYRPVQIPDHGREPALETMRQTLRAGGACGIAVDGPRGPYHCVKRGVIHLASELGFLILPVTFAARRSRVDAGRWDRMEVPRPFTRVVFLCGEPLEVPRGLDAADVRAWQDRLREILEDLDRRAVRRLRGLGRVGRTRAGGTGS
ncbi:MAG: lysophospholipid acyltransferase family protein, partial [Acidobacteriota bacterium]